MAELQIRPLLKFNCYADECDCCNRDHLVWYAVLDRRYIVEVRKVQQTADIGELLIFDHKNNNQLIFRKDVTISYYGVDSPDPFDIESWINTATKFIYKFQKNDKV